MEDIWATTALSLAALMASGSMLLWGYFSLQGDCDIVVHRHELAELTVSATDSRVRLRFMVPVSNQGRQKGMLVEFMCRPEFPGKFFRELEVATKVYSPIRRADGYWEAVLMEKGQTLPAVFEVSLSGPRQALRQLHDLPHLDFVVHYQVIGRAGMRWHTAELRVPFASTPTRSQTDARQTVIN